MLLLPTILKIGLPPRIYVVIYFAINFIDSKILLITWYIHVTKLVDCGYLIEVNMGGMEKSFSKGVKSCLNFELLSNITSHGCGYIHNHV